MNILLVRHGEIPSNISKVYAGRSDELLTNKGIQQAKQAAASLKSFTIRALYSSPIKRALQTAEIIAELNGLTVQVNNSFREMEMGPWEGLGEAEVAARYPEEWRLWNSKPAYLKLQGRETLSELLERTLNGVRKLYEDESTGTLAIVTHVAIIRVLLLWQKNQSLNFYKTIHVPNAAVFELLIDSCP